jgi:hypothetical protein
MRCSKEGMRQVEAMEISVKKTPGFREDNWYSPKREDLRPDNYQFNGNRGCTAKALSVD